MLPTRKSINPENVRAYNQAAKPDADGRTWIYWSISYRSDSGAHHTYWFAPREIKAAKVKTQFLKSYRQWGAACTVIGIMEA